MESTPFFSQVHPLFKDKTAAQSKNRVGKRKFAKETEAVGEKHGHHGRGGHHSQIVATTMGRGGGRGGLWSPGSGASRTLRFALCLESRVCLGSSILGLLGLFC